MNTSARLLLLVIVLLTSTGVNARTRLKFGIPSNLGGAVNSTANDGAFCLSPDGLELYFGSDRYDGSGNWDIWITKRTTSEDEWGSPSNLGSAVNTVYGEGSPYLSSDGLALYFASDRPWGSQGNYDIWMSTRATLNEEWGEAINLGFPVNTWADECFPVLSANNLELYFGELNIFYSSGYGGGDIWVARRSSVSESWDEVDNLGPALNDPYFAAPSSISANGLELYLQSDRPDGYGGMDVWVTTRTSLTGQWQSAVNLGPSINSLRADTAFVISPDGSEAYFCTPLDKTDIWQVPVSLLSTSDLDENGVVDFRDLAVFAEDWLWEQ